MTPLLAKLALYVLVPAILAALAFACAGREMRQHGNGRRSVWDRE